MMMVIMKGISFTFLGALLILANSASAQLRTDFYAQSCPNVSRIVRESVQNAIIAETRMAASLLRLHFHDCFVNGCDASILLDDNGTFVGEKTAGPNNNSVRGFSVIDDAKAAVESACPLTVSCADILALAARHSVLLSGGPSWRVPLGRRDSLTANRTAANVGLPGPTDSISIITSKFQAVGMRTSDIVTLSGGHTIGRARCATFSSRLFNFNNTGAPDTTIESSTLADLQSVCPQGGDANALTALDRKSIDWFDNHYFKNLLNNSGVLQSDQLLVSGADVSSDLKAQVQKYAENESAFFQDFTDGMLRMSQISPLTGSDGEIRQNCRSIN